MKTLLMTAATAMALTACASAKDAEKAGKQAIVPQGTEWAVDQFGYSPAVRAGDFIFLSGVVATLPQDENGVMAEANDENLTSSYEAAFQGIANILAAADAEWNDVVEMITYHTDLPGQIDAFFGVKAKWHEEPYPAWTALDIDRLYPDNGVTEIKVTVYKPLDD